MPRFEPGGVAVICVALCAFLGCGAEPDGGVGRVESTGTAAASPPHSGAPMKEGRIPLRPRPPELATLPDGGGGEPPHIPTGSPLEQ